MRLIERLKGEGSAFEVAAGATVSASGSSGSLLSWLSLAGDEPLEVQFGIMLGNAADKVIARFVPAGEDVRNTRTRDVDRVGELCLGNVLR